MQPPAARRTYLLNQVEIAFMVRRLLADFAQWTRELTLLSVMEGGDVEAARQRLSRNAEDFAALIRQLYGERNAAEFQGILDVRNALVLEIINAIKANDTQRINDLNIQWYAVADSAAEILSTLNSNFDRNELQTTFYDLIYMTENEAMQILSGNYAQSIQQYDQILERSMQLADDISIAIIRQLQI